MKASPLLALASVVVCVVVVALFSRQSGLEEEIASLRGALEKAQAARANVSQPAGDLPAVASSGIGSLAPTDDDARARLSEMERILNGHADILEQLVAVNERIDAARTKAAMRAWGPEQATGAPDTMTAGDQRTAWAPATADGGMEWIEAEFETAADLARIVVRQTCNPGCITKVSAITANGTEVPVWAGNDPSRGQALADTPFAVAGGIQAKRVKIYIDTSRVAGWEEIDAVQIVGRDGAGQWAKSVTASSTYASGGMRGGWLSGDTDLFLQDSAIIQRSDEGITTLHTYFPKR